MKTTSVISILLALCAVGATLVAQSATEKLHTKQSSRSWFKNREWLGGLKLAPHKSVNQLEFAKQYRLHKAFWDSAFAFLRNQDLGTLPKGKYPIDGDNVFASVTEDSTKDFEKTSWESHRTYADIQYVIRGEEQIGVCNVASATVTQPYDGKKDVAHYAAKGTRYRATPAILFIFFPSDAHRPNITPGGNRVDKKVVIKVRLANENSN